MLLSFFGFSMETLITDILSAIGLLMIMIVPLVFGGYHRKVLNQRLHTVIDGTKLFEKLKYDLKLSTVPNIDKVRLYQNQHYAETIFKGAMEYNRRDVIWYFNERTAKKVIWNNISKKAWSCFWIWCLFIAICMAGSKMNLINWLFEMKSLNKESGIVSIWILFAFTAFFHTIIKLLEYFKVKKTINDEVRQINLAKKEKVWLDFKILFWIEIAMTILGFVFILINIPIV